MELLEVGFPSIESAKTPKYLSKKWTPNVLAKRILVWYGKKMIFTDTIGTNPGILQSSFNKFYAFCLHI